MPDLPVVLEPIDEHWAATNSAPLGGGVMLPKRFIARCEIGAFRVILTVDADVQGPHVSKVEVLRKGAPEVTGEVLRKVPVASIANEAVKRALFIETEDKNVVFGAYDSFQNAPENVRKEWPGGDLNQVLRFVSWQYRLAEAVGEGPTASVAKGMQVSRATAGRMVAEARQRGFLPTVGNEARDILNMAFNAGQDRGVRWNLIGDDDGVLTFGDEKVDSDAKNEET